MSDSVKKRGREEGDGGGAEDSSNRTSPPPSSPRRPSLPDCSPRVKECAVVHQKPQQLTRLLAHSVVTCTFVLVLVATKG